MTKKPKQEAEQRGRGRPALVPGEEALVVTIRMTPALKAKLARIGGEAGGAAWIRAAIERAKEPQP